MPKIREKTFTLDEYLNEHMSTSKIAAVETYFLSFVSLSLIVITNESNIGEKIIFKFGV